MPMCMLHVDALLRMDVSMCMLHVDALLRMDGREHVQMVTHGWRDRL